MPVTPWKSFGRAEPERQYLALLTLLPLKRLWQMPWFLVHTGRIVRQLGKSPGLVGFSLMARPFAKHFWTLSVWEDEAALNDFVREQPHAETMRVMPPHMGATRFIRWNLSGSEIPPAWDDALRR
jgi:hypothetical protein